MQLLVTGATGFVGRQTIPILLEANHRVVAIVRPGSGDRLPRHESLDVVEADPLRVEDLASALENCDAVVHLLGIRREAIKRTGLTYEDVDVGSVRAMIEAMRLEGVRRILLLSAGAIGKSEYVRCKGMAERLVIDAGLDYTIFRPAFIVGPGQRWPRVMTPVLSAMAHLPGHTGDVARRAGNITAAELGEAFCRALEDPGLVREILDVPGIRTCSRGNLPRRTAMIDGAG